MLEASVTHLEIIVRQDVAALEAVAALFDHLNRAGIRYCHWKSNLRLAQALTGQTDLDLLVDRQHSQLFRQILAEHHLKALVAAPGKQYPAIEHYLGFDSRSGKLFHLHVHYQLVLGEQFVKNYRLPLERHFLDSVRMQAGVLIPAPELELIVLSLRALLKYRDRDALKDILSVRSSGLPAAILKEIAWLRGQTSPARLTQTLEEIGDIIPADLVMEFLQIVTNAPRAGYQFYRLRRRLRQALRGYQRHHRLKAAGKYFQQLWQRSRLFRRLSPGQKMTLANGGQTLALVGADGSGKSTMSHLLQRWLAWKLDVQLYYLGSKQPSYRSKLLYLLFRMARRTHRAVSDRLGDQNYLTRLLESLRQMLLYSHHLSVGYDRYHRYLASRQKAAGGSIVIYDRYPLAAPLDGPKIDTLAEAQTGAISRIFSRLEQHLYRQFGSPDIMVAFDVSPAVSQQRKPDHDLATIRAKSRLVRQLIAQAGHKRQRFNLLRLDADQPFAEVSSQLKTTIWKLL